MTLQPLTPVIWNVSYKKCLFCLNSCELGDKYFVLDLRKNKKIHIFLLSLESLASSLLTISVRRWLQVTPAHMVAFLSLVVLQRKFFLLWWLLIPYSCRFWLGSGAKTHIFLIFTGISGFLADTTSPRTNCKGSAWCWMEVQAYFPRQALDVVFFVALRSFTLFRVSSAVIYYLVCVLILGAKARHWHELVMSSSLSLLQFPMKLSRMFLCVGLYCCFPVHASLPCYIILKSNMSLSYVHVCVSFYSFECATIPRKRSIREVLCS